MRNLLYVAAAALVVVGMAIPSNAQDDAEKKKREDVFGKSFEDKVEDAVDDGCDWLKKQQGVDPIDPKPVFGKFPENPPLYGSGTPHRYLIARTAFPIQALCKSGCFFDEPEIEKAMEWLRENYTENGAVGMMQGFVGSTTYEDATLLNAVEAYYISAWETKEGGYSNPKKRFKKVEDEDGKRHEVPVKRWGTEEKGAKKKKKDRNFKLDRKDQKMCEIAVKALESRFRRAYGGGGWRYAKDGVGASDPQVDVSATQYAILGLKCATRLGIRYDKKLFLEVFRMLRGQQDKEGPVVKGKWKKREGDDDDKKGRGTSSEPPPVELKARGWGYARQSNHQPLDKTTYGSMTAAAVNALILIRDEMVDDPAQKKAWEDMEKECNQMIGDGLAWMINNWDMTQNPGAGKYRYYYYLYTVERLGMLGGIDEIGGHDWYLEGADVLLKDQQDSGMWDIDNEIDPSDIYNTCYALLFLKRATDGVDRPIPVITGGDGED
ncbi:MAG: hypothetical protein K8I27_09360 [Planctomycetes bacterium]|nr:hypothetical protein [Planctomycetota bacterium]